MAGGSGLPVVLRASDWHDASLKIGQLDEEPAKALTSGQGLIEVGGKAHRVDTRMKCFLDASQFNGSGAGDRQHQRQLPQDFLLSSRAWVSLQNQSKKLQNQSKKHRLIDECVASMPTTSAIVTPGKPRDAGEFRARCAKFFTSVSDREAVLAALDDPAFSCANICIDHTGQYLPGSAACVNPPPGADGEFTLHFLGGRKLTLRDPDGVLLPRLLARDMQDLATLGEAFDQLRGTDADPARCDRDVFRMACVERLVADQDRRRLTFMMLLDAHARTIVATTPPDATGRFTVLLDDGTRFMLDDTGTHLPAGALYRHVVAQGQVSVRALFNSMKGTDADYQLMEQARQLIRDVDAWFTANGVPNDLEVRQCALARLSHGWPMGFRYFLSTAGTASQTDMRERVLEHARGELGKADAALHEAMGRQPGPLPAALNMARRPTASALSSDHLHQAAYSHARLRQIRAGVPASGYFTAFFEGQAPLVFHDGGPLPAGAPEQPTLARGHLRDALAMGRYETLAELFTQLEPHARTQELKAGIRCQIGHDYPWLDRAQKEVLAEEVEATLAQGEGATLGGQPLGGLLAAYRPRLQHEHYIADSPDKRKIGADGVPLTAPERIAGEARTRLTTFAETHKTAYGPHASQGAYAAEAAARLCGGACWSDIKTDPAYSSACFAGFAAPADGATNEIIVRFRDKDNGHDRELRLRFDGEASIHVWGAAFETHEYPHLEALFGSFRLSHLDVLATEQAESVRQWVQEEADALGLAPADRDGVVKESLRLLDNRSPLGMPVARAVAVADTHAGLEGQLHREEMVAAHVARFEHDVYENLVRQHGADPDGAVRRAWESLVRRLDEAPPAQRTTLKAGVYARLANASIRSPDAGQANPMSDYACVGTYLQSALDEDAQAELKAYQVQACYLSFDGRTYRVSWHDTGRGYSEATVVWAGRDAESMLLRFWQAIVNLLRLQAPQSDRVRNAQRLQTRLNDRALEMHESMRDTAAREFASASKAGERQASNANANRRRAYANAIETMMDLQPNEALQQWNALVEAKIATDSRFSKTADGGSDIRFIRDASGRYASFIAIFPAGDGDPKRALTMRFSDRASSVELRSMRLRELLTEPGRHYGSLAEFIDGLRGTPEDQDTIFLANGARNHVMSGVGRRLGGIEQPTLLRVVERHLLAEPSIAATPVMHTTSGTLLQRLARHRDLDKDPLE